MEKLDKYSFTKAEKALVIASLKWDCIRQIDSCHFGVTFCKPRLKMLAELSKDDSLSFFWSRYQFGCFYRSLDRFYNRGLCPNDCDFWRCRRLLKDYRSTFLVFFPFQVGRYELSDIKSHSVSHA